MSSQSISIQPKTYHFHQVDACNMCGKDASTAKVLGMRLNQSQGKNPRNKTGIAVSICKCRNCGLNFPQPMPIPNDISDHYGIPPNEYWKNDSYFEIDPNYFGRQISDAKRLLSFKEGMKALDIGLGIGKAAIAMKNAGFEVWGIEPSEPFLNKARELTGLPDDRLQHTPIEEAKFQDDFFDFISFGAVLEHLYDPSSCIQKAMEWLVPGGVIQIEVPSSNHLMTSFLNFYFRGKGTNFVTNLSPMHAPYHLYAFTLDGFRINGQMNGYKVDYHYIDVASIRHVPKVFHPLLRTWMKARQSGMQLTVWLRKID